MRVELSDLFAVDPVAFDADPTGCKPGHRPSRFDGPTFDPHLDGERLSRQLDAVRAWMLEHTWQTLAEMAVGTGHGEAAVASISARLRDLRKARFGGYIVERRRRTAGTWEYRIATSSEGVSPECAE